MSDSSSEEGPIGVGLGVKKVPLKKGLVVVKKVSTAIGSAPTLAMKPAATTAATTEKPEKARQSRQTRGAEFFSGPRCTKGYGFLFCS